MNRAKMHVALSMNDLQRPVMDLSFIKTYHQHLYTLTEVTSPANVLVL